MCHFRFIVIVLPMKSRRWCTVGNTKKILIAVWIVAIALSSPTFKILVNISLFVNMFSMK